MAIEAHDEAVERDLVLRQRRVLCAMHRRYFGGEFVITEAEPGMENDAPVHGICKKCEERFLAEKSAA